MALSNIFRRNPLKSLDQKKLRETEMILRSKSRELLVEIKRIENEIKITFDRSKQSSSQIEEISLARTIKTLTQKREMKASAHARVEKELVAVSNLLIFKEHEADLKAAGIWEPLQKLPPDKLEPYLTGLQLDQQDRETRVDTITKMTSSLFKPPEEQEEGLEDIMQMIDALKQGNLEPEAAKDIITKKEEEE